MIIIDGDLKASPAGFAQPPPYHLPPLPTDQTPRLLQIRNPVQIYHPPRGGTEVPLRASCSNSQHFTPLCHLRECSCIRGGKLATPRRHPWSDRMG